MDKNALKNLVLEKLRQSLAFVVQSAQAAKEGATHPEMKAENKYDTRGLETAYLAAAQSRRIQELQSVINRLESLNIMRFDLGSKIGVTALVELIDYEDQIRKYLILPVAGGISVDLEGVEVTTLTPDSPLGRRLINCRAGDSFSLRVSNSERNYEVIEVS